MARSTAFDGFCGVDDDNNYLELSWHWNWNRPVSRVRGVTGWATVVRSTNTAVAAVGSVRRYHKCAQNPCTARWKHASAFFGPPVHVRPVESFPDLPNARAFAPALPIEAAAAGSSPPAAPAVERPALGPAVPAVAEASLLVPGSVEVTGPQPIESAVAGAAPEPSSLQSGVPPPAALSPPPAAALSPAAAGPPADAPPGRAACAPSGAQLREADAAPAASDAAVVDLTNQCPAAAAAESAMLGKLLQLARDIRGECKHVGYSFFVLFALSRQCKPYMWEGESRVPLIDTFAQWALELDFSAVAVDGVCCCFDASHGVWVQVSEQHPLKRVGHFMAGITNSPEMRDGSSLENFYRKLGVIILPTCTDGDCAIDTACVMLGLPRTLENRNALRQEPAQIIKQLINHSLFG